MIGICHKVCSIISFLFHILVFSLFFSPCISICPLIIYTIILQSRIDQFSRSPLNHFQRSCRRGFEQRPKVDHRKVLEVLDNSLLIQDRTTSRILRQRRETLNGVEEQSVEVFIQLTHQQFQTARTCSTAML
jgi:hypothetical protein